MIGRPSKFTEATGAEICRRLGEGESLRAICRDSAMPAEATVRGWVIDGIDEEFAARYHRARELQAFGWAEEILEVADDGTNDFVERERENGSKYVAFDAENVQRSRLRIDARKWLVSKILPKIYGDKVSAEIKAEVTHNGDAPVTPLQLAREIAFALRVGIEAQAAAERGETSSASDQ